MRGSRVEPIPTYYCSATAISAVPNKVIYFGVLSTYWVQLDLLSMSVSQTMDFLVDGQVSTFCPDQHVAMVLTLIASHKLTQSL